MLPPPCFSYQLCSGVRMLLEVKQLLCCTWQPPWRCCKHRPAGGAPKIRCWGKISHILTGKTHDRDTFLLFLKQLEPAIFDLGEQPRLIDSDRERQNERGTYKKKKQKWHRNQRVYSISLLGDRLLRERWGKWWGSHINHIKPLSYDSNLSPDLHWIMHALPVITFEEGGDK